MEGLQMADGYELANSVEERKKELVNAMTDFEYYPSVVEKDVDISRFPKIPFTRIPALGVAFEPLKAAFQNVVNAGGSGIYKVTIPPGRQLASFKNGSGYLGSVLTENGAVGGGQAVLNPLVFNPTMIFMAVALANIDKKLDKIQETQQEILGFLVQKEKSEMKGDLNFLSDVLNNFKFNWNNDKYKSSNHIKVLDIKQSSERKIDFYREQISSKTNKKSFFQSDQEIKKKIEKVQSEFKDYQLALYIYSFSAFLEVMLLENFDSKYLDNIVNKIEDYAFNYRDLYTKCYQQIEVDSKSSIQSNFLKGVASVNTVAGKAISKIPGINKSQIDETLIESGIKLGEFGSKRTEKTMLCFVDSRLGCILPFKENIQAVNKLYNQPMEVLFDNDNIYLGMIED